MHQKEELKKLKIRCPVCNKKPAECGCSNDRLFGWVGGGQTRAERERRRRMRAFWFHLTGRFHHPVARGYHAAP